MRRSGWPPQLRWSVHQPGAGRLTEDGPGPSGSETAAVRALPASVARMRSGPGPSTLDAQRILLPLFGSAGACRAFFGLQRMATMLPEAPITCGIAISGGVNPARAHVGSDDTGLCLEARSRLRCGRTLVNWAEC